MSKQEPEGGATTEPAEPGRSQNKSGPGSERPVGGLERRNMSDVVQKTYMELTGGWRKDVAIMGIGGR